MLSLAAYVPSSLAPDNVKRNLRREGPYNVKGTAPQRACAREECEATAPQLKQSFSETVSNFRPLLEMP